MSETQGLRSMQSEVDPREKFFFVIMGGTLDNGQPNIEDAFAFQSKAEAEAFALADNIEFEGDVFLGECIVYGRAQHPAPYIEPLTPKRQRRKREANGAGEPAQVEAAPAHDTTEPPLPLDASDSADIPPFLRR